MHESIHANLKSAAERKIHAFRNPWSTEGAPRGWTGRIWLAGCNPLHEHSLCWDRGAYCPNPSLYKPGCNPV